MQRRAIFVDKQPRGSRRQCDRRGWGGRWVSARRWNEMTSTASVSFTFHGLVIPAAFIECKTCWTGRLGWAARVSLARSLARSRLSWCRSFRFARFAARTRENLSACVYEINRATILAIFLLRLDLCGSISIREESFSLSSVNQKNAYFEISQIIEFHIVELDEKNFSRCYSTIFFDKMPLLLSSFSFDRRPSRTWWCNFNIEIVGTEILQNQFSWRWPRYVNTSSSYTL